MRPVLVVLGGLPGSGKTSIATALAAETATTYFRVDRIEQAIVAWSALSHPVGPVGYAVAHQLAREQLTLRLDVIIECVNPVASTRDAWSATAADCGAGIVEVEVVCSDRAEHRRRVETRTTDVEGLVKPTWAEVLDRAYEPWSRDLLVVDTAASTVAEAVRRVAAAKSSAALQSQPASDHVALGHAPGSPEDADRSRSLRASRTMVGLLPHARAVAPHGGSAPHSGEP